MPHTISENSQIVKKQEIVLAVPYLSQYLDIDDKMDAITSCGMTCVKMILDYNHIPAPDIGTMVKQGKASGGYNQSGWIHDYFVNLFKSYSLQSHRREKMDTTAGLNEIKLSIDNNHPVICSVAKRLFDKRVFHMILIIGYKMSANGSLQGFYYHNPESTSYEAGSNCYVAISEFIEYWRHMAIFVYKITKDQN